MKLTSAFVLIVLFAGQAISQEPQPSLLMQEDSRSLFWEISGNDLQQPSYIYGTIHLICREYMDIAEEADSILQQTDLLTLELDLTDQNEMAQIQRLSMNEGGHNISVDLDDEAIEVLNELLAPSVGINMDQAGMMKPIVLQSMVMMAKLSGYCEEGSSSYEEYFLERAAEYEIPVEGLESAEFQMSVLDRISMEEQIEELEKMVLEDGYVIGQFQDIFDHYRTEDISGMYASFQEDKLWMQYQEDLLDTRNQAWVPDMEELMREQSVFFAVGAGHLAGEQGVLQLLKDAGYEVNPVH